MYQDIPLCCEVYLSKSLCEVSIYDIVEKSNIYNNTNEMEIYMKFIEDIKSKIKEYKHYKKTRYSNSLTVLAKVSDLISVYSIKRLRMHQEFK